jgi:succinoglycan biosynthesis protein ExoO
VTVVMPAYNAEPWIGTAIESVLDQSLTSWELIVVDDGSSDNTRNEVEKFRDPRISMMVRDEARLVDDPNGPDEHNKGPSYARNRGINAAKGTYIALLDADDWFESNFWMPMTGSRATISRPQPTSWSGTPRSRW